MRKWSLDNVACRKSEWLVSGAVEWPVHLVLPRVKRELVSIDKRRVWMLLTEAGDRYYNTAEEKKISPSM